MNVWKLAWKNANGSAVRSWTIIIWTALLSAFTIAATIIIGGAQTSLRLANDRLGADIIVVTAGSEDRMENAFLMGVPVRTWMPRANLEKIAAVPGVEKVSPQLFLATLRGALCCSVPEMFLIAYEPETDFTLRPWLEKHLEGGLGLNDAVGGAFVYVPEDPGYIQVYGSIINLRGKLEQTGTGLDQSMFFTVETAHEIARLSHTLALQDLTIPPDSISAAMIKLRRGADAKETAELIRQALPDTAVVESSSLFHSQRVQIMSLLKSILALLAVEWLLAVLLIGLVFSMAVNERRQEIGVLRALGFQRRFVFDSLLLEGLYLAVGGSLAGTVFAIMAVTLFRNLIIQQLGITFLIPSPLGLAGLGLVTTVLAIINVVLGAMIPTARISKMDPSVAMRK